MTFYIGVDLGGTHIRAGIVDVNTGKIINRRKILVKREDGFSAVLGRLMEACEDQLETAIKRGISISGMGIGVPGQVDQSYKLIIRLPNFSDDWSNLNLADKVKKKTNLHCYVYNDAQCITFGEFLFGAGFGYRSGMCLVIGTGVGSGLFLNGQLVVGRSGVAGEVGHIVVDEEGALCGCGNYGCLETIVSGPAITSQGVRAVLQGLNTELTGYSGRNICKINSKLISELAKKGDSVSINIYQRAGRYLGIVISDIVNILSPERIVISGGLSAAGDILLKPVRDAIKQRVKIVKYRNDLVVQGTLGDYAGVIGSAISAHRQR